MKKLKFLSLIIVAIGSAFVFTACSCKKVVEPTGIFISPTQRTVFVSAGEYIVRYDVLPQNVKDLSVYIVSKNPAVATVDTNHSRLASGSFMVSPVAEGVAIIEVSINGTAIKATHTVTFRKDLENLPTPENLVYNASEDKIEFDRVSDAEEYQIRAVSEDNKETVINFTPTASEIVNGKITKDLFNGSTPLLNTQTEYTISVSAIGDGITYLNSDYSQDVTAMKLEAPKNINLVNGIISWDNNALYESGVVSYVISVNGVTETVTTNSFILNTAEAVDYLIKIKAINNKAELTNLSDSNWSSDFLVKKLVTPTLRLVNDEKSGELYKNSVLRFDSVLGAVSYQITFAANNKPDIVVNILATEDLSVIIDNRFESGVEYTATIIAKGNGTVVLNSESAKINFIKLNAPANVRLQDNKVMFDQITGINAEITYQIIIKHGNDVYQTITTDNTVDLSNISNKIGNYELFIKTLVKNHNTALLFANSNSDVSLLSFNKLNSPIITRVENDSTVVWGSVEGATAYEVYFGDSESPVKRVLASDFTGQEFVRFKLNSIVSINEGKNLVSVVAIGGGNFVSSSFTERQEYEFVKLASISGFTVNNSNNEISWPAVSGALEYFVKENNGVFVSNGQSTKYSFVNMLDTNNKIVVYAKGNSQSVPVTIDSDAVLFEAERIPNASSFKIANGVLKMNANANHEYDIYVSGVKVATLANTNEYAFAQSLLINEVEVVSVIARPKSTSIDKNKLSSKEVSFNVLKLNSVDVLTLESQRDAVNKSKFVLSWQEVLNAEGYILHIKHANDEFAKIYYTVDNNLTISEGLANDIVNVSGNYEIYITAMGSKNLLLDGGQLGYINSNKTPAKHINKLLSPTNVRVENGFVKFTDSNEVDKVENYEIKFEKGEVGKPGYVTWTIETADKSYKIASPEGVSVDLEGEYLISVRSLGNGFNITSNYSTTKQVVQLSQVKNVSVLNGVLVWQDYNISYPTQLLNITYSVYAENLTDSGDILLLQSDIEETRLNITKYLEEDKEYVIYVVANSDNYLTGHYGQGIRVFKLGVVSDLQVNKNLDTNNYIISWQGLTDDMNTNLANGYNVYIKKGNETTLYKTVNGNEFSIIFDEFDELESGVYEIFIQAFGGKVQSLDKNFITGELTEGVSLTKLDKVNNISVLNGVVSWDQANEENLPTGYLINVYEVTAVQEQEVLVLRDTNNLPASATNFNLNTLGKGNYEVAIISLGNDTNKVNSGPAKLRVEKIDSELLNLRVQKGTLIWTEYEGVNVKYDVFLKLLNQQDYEKIDTVTGTSYEFNAVELIVGQTYEVVIKVTANNMISSDFSRNLLIQKLPLVQNFKVNKHTDSEKPHYFNWNAVANSSGYHIIPTLSGVTFDGAIEKDVTEKDIVLDTAGTYDFKIKAVGSTSSSTTEVNYISSDYGQPETIVFLDSVKNLRVENNLLIYNASHMYTGAITTPDEYHIFVYEIVNGTKTLVYKKQNAMQLSWNFTNELGEKLGNGTYYVNVIAVSNSNNKVNSLPAVLENVVVLKAPQNVRSTNGFVNFNLSEDYDEQTSYEVYLDNVLVATLNDNSPASTNIINGLLANSDIVSLKIRAVSANKIYSKFSDELLISKLTAPEMPKITIVNNFSYLTWPQTVWSQTVLGQEDSNYFEYYIKILPFVDELKEVSGYDEETGFIRFAVSKHVNDNSEITYLLPNNLPAGQYEISVSAIGSTLNYDFAGVHYLTSDFSTQKSVIYLSEPTNIRLDKGIMKWNAVPGAVEYELEFYSLINGTENANFITTKKVSSVNFDIMNEPLLSVGKYKVNITAIGNGTTHIKGKEYGEFEFNIAEQPEDFKVVNGYLQWTVSLDTVKKHIFGDIVSYNFSHEDIQLITEILVGNTQGVNPLLVANLYPLFNIELKLNNNVFTIIPSQIEFSANRFIFTHNINRPAGSYDIAMRFIGNSSGAVNGPGKNISAFNEDNELVLVPFSYGKHTNTINAYKLTAPITPVVNQSTSIYENAISFNKVQGASSNGFIQHYLIVAKQKSGTSVITHLVDTNNLQGHNPSNTIVKVYIKDLRDYLSNAPIPVGLIYEIYVVARGTIDSDALTGNQQIYLTSNHTNTSEIMLLQKPQPFSVEGGVISFAAVSNASNHLLKIWNNGDNFLGPTHHDIANGVVSILIDVNKEMLLENPYLTFKDGTYFYQIEDNKSILPNDNGKYYLASTEAIGDGVRAISSDPDHKIKLIKWNSVELTGSGYSKNIIVENGMFKWSHISVVESISQTEVYAQSYKVTVFKQNDVTDEVEMSEIIYKMPYNYRERYVTFELPDTPEYSAFNSDGSRNLYSVKVSVMGGIIKLSEDTDGINFVNSDSVTRQEQSYRLQTAEDLTVTNGIINWSQVNQASGYRVLISESNTIEEKNNGNTIEFELGAVYRQGIYMFAVKATSSSEEYLNSRVSENIKVLKLDSPDLRVQSGEIVWDNSDLPQNQSEYSKLIMAVPNGFDINELKTFDGLEYKLLTDDDKLSSDYIFNRALDAYEILLPNNHSANTFKGLDLKGSPEGNYYLTVKYIGSSGKIVQDNDAFYTVNSDMISMEFKKLSAPTIEIESIASSEGTLDNLVKWNAINNATNYGVVVTKLNASGEEVYSHIFDMGNAKYANYFTVVNGVIKFNLKAVSIHDEEVKPVYPFGSEYFVKVDAYGDNITHESNIAGNFKSNYSNTQAVTIPVLASDIRLTEYGLLTWKNFSEYTTQELRLQYLFNGEMQEEIVSLPAGTNSYKLKRISDNYQIQINTKTTSAQSGYTDPIAGAFRIYSSGDGSVESPYVISTATELNNIGYYPDKEFVLSQNINIQSDPLFSTNWTPIGNRNATRNILESEFTGTLNGNGYEIMNLRFNNTVVPDSIGTLGLFRQIGEYGIVKNLRVNVNAININVARFGVITATNYGTIEKVITTGSVSNIASQRQYTYLAGIAHTNRGLITEVENKVVINGSVSSTTNTTGVAGVAYINYGTLFKVANSGKLTGTTVGGVVHTNESLIVEASNIGAISVVIGENYKDTMVSVGGLVAINNTNGTIRESYVWAIDDSLMRVVNNTDYAITVNVGGLIGTNSGKLENSYVVMGLTNVSGNRGITNEGAIAGSSYGGTFKNVYYQLNSNLSAYSGDVTAIDVYPKDAVTMKSTGFAESVGSEFEIINSYPVLKWQKDFAINN